MNEMAKKEEAPNEYKTGLDVFLIFFRLAPELRRFFSYLFTEKKTKILISFRM
jgi:hypothetical protein